MGELQTVTFLGLTMIVILIVFLSLAKNGQVLLSASGKSTKPRDYLQMLDPNAPIVREGYNENFTVKYEKRDVIQTPMIRQQTRQVVSSEGPAPPIPMTSYETVGVRCSHGNCDYSEIPKEPSASKIEPFQAGSYVQISKTNPFMKIK
jgi:hypothetical protein